ncbi:MAG: type II toxin-antitoxin system prevent-host-death family antitoxin [Thermodesulfobacteriota bacterium]
MNAHTDPQIITKDGEPAFAVIPWEEYQDLIRNQADPDESDIWFPNEVVKANARGDNLIKAWREYLGLTQAGLAAKSGMQQPALARLESGESTPRSSTLKKLAAAMELSVEQLQDSD